MLATQNRIVFLDYLRVVACFMVMAIHSAEPFYLGGAEPNITHIASRWDMLWITVMCPSAETVFIPVVFCLHVSEHSWYFFPLFFAWKTPIHPSKPI